METKLDLIKIIYEDSNLTTRDKLDLINELNYAGIGRRFTGALQKQNANSNKMNAYLKGKLSKTKLIQGAASAGKTLNKGVDTIKKGASSIFSKGK